MGLDMYLNAKRFLWHTEDDIGAKIAEAFPELAGKPAKEVVVEAMYWRKANSIHKWFVDNVQQGVDNCANYYVSREDLETLRQLILEALDKKDASLLPPTSGFFFGSGKVDQNYWEDLRTTEEGLGKCLNDFPQGWDFEYHSSW
jgi:hypothetical protein